MLHIEAYLFATIIITTATTTAVVVVVKAVRRNFFQGGKIIYNRGGKQARVWEGAFPFLRLKLNDLVHTLGGFFGKKINKKVRRKYILFMANVCFLH